MKTLNKVGLLALGLFTFFAGLSIKIDDNSYLKRARKFTNVLIVFTFLSLLATSCMPGMYSPYGQGGYPTAGYGYAPPVVGYGQRQYYQQNYCLPPRHMRVWSYQTALGTVYTGPGTRYIR